MKGLTFMRCTGGGGSIFKQLRAGAIIIGLAWSVSATLAACAVMCAWVVLSAGPVYHFSTFLTAGSLLGAFFGGAVSGKTAGALGAMHGFLAGSLYGLLLAAPVLTGGVEGFSTADLVTRVTVLGLAGATGGVFGLNARHKGWTGLRRKVSNQRIF